MIINNRLVMIFLIIFEISLSTIFFALFSNHELTLQVLSLFALVVSIYIVITSIFLRKIIGYIITFFFIVYSIVMFGRAILNNLINFESQIIAFESLNAYSYSEISQALILSIYCMLGLHIGTIIYAILRKNKFIKNPEQNFETALLSLESLKLTGLIIFFISIIPAIYVLITNFRSGLSGRFISDEDVSSLISLLTNLMLPSIIILMVTYKNKSICILGVLYYGLQLLWGGRGRPILAIAIIIVLYFKVISPRKLKMKNFIWFGVYGVLISNLFVLLREMRQYPLSYWIKDIFIIYVEKFINSNPIMEIIYELGVALAPTAATIRYVPSVFSYQYGMTIIYSLMSAVPDVLRIRPKVATIYGNVPAIIAEESGARFGASMLQDMYLNFGWYSPFFAIIIGFLLCKFSSKFKNEKNIINITFMSILIHPILWWPRSSLGNFFRFSFVMFIIPIILYTIINKMLIQKYPNLRKRI